MKAVGRFILESIVIFVVVVAIAFATLGLGAYLGFLVRLFEIGWAYGNEVFR